MSAVSTGTTSAPATATPTNDADPYVTAATRPSAASRKGRRPRAPRAVTRFTLDLEAHQHQALRMFAVVHQVEASVVCRTLLWLLENDKALADRVLDEIFSEEEPSNFVPEG
jgi:hypothetical protein